MFDFSYKPIAIVLLLVVGGCAYGAFALGRVYGSDELLCKSAGVLVCPAPSKPVYSWWRCSCVLDQTVKLP